MRNPLIVCTLCLVTAPLARAQSVEVNRQNRTIEVTASQKVSVDAEVARVTIGLITTGPTRDGTYEANLKAADGVVKALLAAGLAKSDIISSDIRLGQREPDESPAIRKGATEFVAHQTWVIQVEATSAQKLIDIAVRAGANGVESVEWDVKDAEALEDKARVAAVEKARLTAGQLATSFGGKVGAPLYVSNAVSGFAALALGGQLSTLSTTATASTAGQPLPSFSLQLFPEKIERSAIVRVIFALE